jgi:ADP-ribosylglycohydrolase
MPPRVDQFIGCLLGQCLGDTLGAPVEGRSPEICREYAEQLRPDGEQVGRPPFPFGQYTDDSQLARALLESFVHCRGFDPADYAQRIAAFFVEKRIVGYGRTTAAAAARIAAGVPWDQAGAALPKAGNGSAMRAAPVGLICGSDDKRLVAMAHDQGRVTHADPRCSAGAIAIAAATARALDERPIDPRAFVELIAQLVAPFDETTAAGLRAIPGWLARSPEEVADPIARWGRPEGDQRPGITSFVTGSVLWAIQAFLRTPRDYWATVKCAISPGGDVDTTAAMAGAISGAHNGSAALPQNLVAALEDQGTFRAPELTALATRAHAVAHPSLRAQE